MSVYSFSDQAVQDLDEICNYLAKDNPKTASRIFIDNYIIFYYPSEEGIYVIRVVSGYRDLESLFS